MTLLRLVSKFLLLLSVPAVLAMAADQDAVHAFAGAITKVDKATKTLSLKSVDGSEEVFKYTEKTAVRSGRSAAMAAKSGALDTYFAGKEGTHVIVRYTVKGADKTASSVDDYGKDAFKVGRGTITKVDKGAHTIAIKSDDGVESTYDLTKDAAVDTEQGVVKGTEYTAKQGDKVVVHYTEDAGKKVVRFFKRG